MFDAILRVKVMYGLETLVKNTAIKNKLDVFQVKCMRKILQLPTTYINRSYTPGSGFKKPFHFAKPEVKKTLNICQRKPNIAIGLNRILNHSNTVI